MDQNKTCWVLERSARSTGN